MKVPTLSIMPGLFFIQCVTLASHDAVAFSEASGRQRSQYDVAFLSSRRSARLNLSSGRQCPMLPWFEPETAAVELGHKAPPFKISGLRDGRDGRLDGGTRRRQEGLAALTKRDQLGSDRWGETLPFVRQTTK